MQRNKYFMETTWAKFISHPYKNRIRSSLGFIHMAIKHTHSHTTHTEYRCAYAHNRPIYCIHLAILKEKKFFIRVIIWNLLLSTFFSLRLVVCFSFEGVCYSFILFFRVVLRHSFCLMFIVWQLGFLSASHNIDTHIIYFIVIHIYIYMCGECVSYNMSDKLVSNSHEHWALSSSQKFFSYNEARMKQVDRHTESQRREELIRKRRATIKRKMCVQRN